ncbi:concanavalin A-like lectin/glucanase domain-containing protein [Tribonema minus]|uniref:Concanavalin A-like lectin/glucanase domain-containing protein n=1 Tax=Tribonema minus TaxID=303371 RepID=A0A835Z9F9_9STRA|nr:concanavalin A-like lectin/glucanase domain-containing protein [Tribonema minus]
MAAAGRPQHARHTRRWRADDGADDGSDSSSSPSWGPGGQCIASSASGDRASFAVDNGPPKVAWALKTKVIAGVVVVACGAAIGLGVGELLWRDEFAGTALDDTMWEYAVGNGAPNVGFGDRYEKANVLIQDDMLVLEGRLEPQPLPNNSTISSGKISTKPAFAVKYGRIEIAATLPKGRGAWPKIFMLPLADTYGAWPGSGELGIMETYNTQWDDAASILSTLKFGWPADAGANVDPKKPDGMGSRGQNGCTLKPGTSFAEGEHVFVMEWAPKYIKYYVDSLLFCEVTKWWAGQALGTANKAAPFDQPFKASHILTSISLYSSTCLIIDLAIGGDPTGAYRNSEIPVAAMPMRMEVDFVRVWELTQDEMSKGNPFPGTVAPMPAEEKALAGYNMDPVLYTRTPWTLHPAGTRIDTEFFDHGPHGTAYDDATPAVNSGTSALRPFAGVEVSEDLVYVKPPGTTHVSSSGAYVTLDKGEWTRYSVTVDTPYHDMWVEVKHSIIGGGQFRLIADSTNCLAPETDGGALLLDAHDLKPTWIPNVQPASLGAEGPCWQTQRWQAKPLVKGGGHYLVLCSLTNGLNVQYMDLTPYEPTYELKAGPGCGW